jgi:hypothetical protein
MMIRMLNHDPSSETYDFLTRNAGGRLVHHAVTAQELSDIIQDHTDKAYADRLRSLRRLAHRFPWSWVPMTAADGRTETS